MSLLGWIIAFSLLGGVLSVLCAAVILLASDRLQQRLLPHLVSFATGALLGAAFLALLPHALESQGADPHHITLAVLLGVLVFFLLEKMVLWRHCHYQACDGHIPGQDQGRHGMAAGTLILIGDGIHNFVDGVLIAAAFLTDFTLGVVTALAVAAHEIPQEVGDFAILLHSGFSRLKALAYNLLSSLATVVGAVLAWASLAELRAALPYVLAVAAASFIYIAVADLIPGLHKRLRLQDTAVQVLLIGCGVGLIFGLDKAMH